MAGIHYTPLGYCTKQDVENYLLLEIDNSFDEQIDDWIATVEAQVNKYLGYSSSAGILLEDIVGEKVDGRITTDLDLIVFPRKLPVVTVSGMSLSKGTTSISIELEDGDGNPRYDINADENYILIAGDEINTTGTSILRSFGELRNTRFFTKINYRAGYATVPADIRQATVELVADIVMRHANKEGLEQITQGRVTKRWRQLADGHSDFYLDAMSLLKPYRIASRWL